MTAEPVGTGLTAEDGEGRDRPRYGEGREALLRAAIRVVATSGLRNLTYRAVAREAGVTHGLVAHHFGSRDTLLEEALRYSLQLSVETSSLESGTGQIDDFARDLPEFVDREPDVQAFQYELILESRRRPELRPYVEELYDYYRGAARRELARLGIQDPALADVAYAALDGLVFQQISVASPENTRRSVDALRTMLLAARDAPPARD
ncbi:TetR/AcrR family transcriptional regulator [Kineosporia sp. A_224]|uniref:TetR/AcrR family transcriptional regulator n=1 Tax=Kineosporia sp. A_224 TaxID=1962180 RepID=UPI0018E9E5C1|nr:TetR family transcriptional regulator [Kineosporia sp. A_224]